MTSLARSYGESGAESVVSGTISIYAKWSEDIYFRDPDGAAMDLTGLAFYFQFRSDASSTSADVTLSTTAGTLSIEADSGAVDSILRISVDGSVFSSYEGDMAADLVAVDGSGDEVHYAHGVVSFRNNPVAI
jgi:hypothetical protein